MKRLFLVEPVVALYAFATFLYYPLVQQYAYRRIWLQVTNTTYLSSDNTSRCVANSNSSNQSHYNEEVQRQTSLFSVYTNILSTVPSLVVTLILVTYSDQGGRKIAIIMPMIGTLIYTLSLLTVSYFELSIYLLFGSSILSALCGGMGTFLGGCFAYIADLCEDDRQKTYRMAGLEMMIGLLSGLAALSSGYFLRTVGFNWPFLTSSLMLVLILLYAIFVLEETVKKAPTSAVTLDGSPWYLGMKQMLRGVCQMLAGASCSFAGVSLFTYCGVPQLLIVLLGILSVVSAMLTAAFAKTTLLMFIVRIPMLLSIMPFPVLRSMMSKIVPKSEQGALFACLSFMESLSNNVSSIVFYSIYAATVSWCPAFVFLLSAGLCVIPLTALGMVSVIGVDVATEVQRPKRFNSEEENPVQDQSDHSPLLT
ncbi:solute carrier family 46 member 3 isoform X2 [Astatotilapia calliptera]|uniref:solute carrier family 46 member 3 isoform X2 n=1 Tax=Astatotilapia calliptera TaxID=8154 RepID=UPI000E409C28|nr:solute carrier family 46 member 3-like isoform X2 [Astatotilapia calliptera]